MTAVKLEEKKLPSSLFEVPKGYTKTEGIGSLLGQMNNPQNMEAWKQMIQQNMTPEKMEELRKMMENAVRPQEGGTEKK